MSKTSNKVLQMSSTSGRQHKSRGRYNCGINVPKTDNKELQPSSMSGRQYKNRDRYKPVSYTHLDVYKRQVPCNKQHFT